MNNKAEKEKSEDALHEFRCGLKNKSKLLNGNIKFLATVNYSFRQQDISEVLEGYFDHFHHTGTILRFSDGEILTSDIVHLDLDPQYQKFQFIDERLIVSHSSPKIGDYVVEIKEAL